MMIIEREINKWSLKIKIAKTQKETPQFLDNYTMDFQNLTHRHNALLFS